MIGGDAEWLAGLQVGDEVAIPSRIEEGRFAILPVTAASAEAVVINEGMSFRRSDGRGVRIGSLEYRIVPATDEIRDRVRRRELADRIEDMLADGFPGVPTDRIEAALALLSPPESEESSR